jgi:hypothetical protein
MQMAENATHPTNTESSIDTSREPGSNESVHSAAQSAKDSRPSRSIDEGTQIDGSIGSKANVAWARHESLQPDSNVTAERERHSERARSPSLSTDEGMQIDESQSQTQNAESSIRES